MNTNYIKDNIDTIFEIEKINLTKNKSFYYIENFDSSKLLPTDPMYKSPPQPLNLDSEPPDNIAIEWETYQTLKKLYRKIDTKDEYRTYFMHHLINILINDVTNFGDTYNRRASSSLAFYFLLQIGKKLDIIEALNEISNQFSKDRYLFRLADKQSSSRQGLLEDIIQFMHFEPNYFNSDLLKTLENLTSANILLVSPIKEKFQAAVSSTKYSILNNELMELNEELNIDREKVIEYISKYRFPKEMQEFLLEIENLSEFAEWKSINSGMIGNLRTFHEKLIENIAKQINSKTGIDYPTDQQTLMGNYRNYIKQNLKLSSNDTKLIKSFTDILNEQGSHAFLSEKKYFNLTKNIGIEISLFLFSKLDEFLKE